MVKNISLVKDGMLIVIRSIMIIFSTFCANQIDFSRFWGLFSNPIILITTYRIEMIESALDRWDVRLSYAYKNFVGNRQTLQETPFTQYFLWPVHDHHFSYIFELPPFGFLSLGKLKSFDQDLQRESNFRKFFVSVSLQFPTIL